MFETLFTESQVELEKSEYYVVEDEGLVEVCVVLLGNALLEAGSVTIETEPGTAKGNTITTHITNLLYTYIP